jgi:hypothetical protein
MRVMAGEGETDESPMSLGPPRAKLSTLIAYARPMNRLFRLPGWPMNCLRLSRLSTLIAYAN